MAIRRVSAEEAHRLMVDDGYLYLDVRSVQEFEAGHPSGAYNVPLLHMAPDGMRPNPAFLSEVEAAFPKDRAILVGCRSGQRSLRAGEAMAAAGYADLVDVRPGFAGTTDPFGGKQEPGWQPSGLPIERDAQPGRSYADLSAKTKGET
jgi:rhodanese-related sulfurtransferase